jgi:hypothetical protein
MVDIGRGMAAGFVATMVFSLLVLAAVALGLMPQLAAVAMFGRVLWAQGAPAVAWIAHLLIGTVLWGGLFAAFSPRLPGRSHTARGMAFGLVTWLLAMVVLMPLAGGGPFGLSLGLLAPATTLALHLVFGAVLGATYSWLLERRAQERHGPPGG